MTQKLSAATNQVERKAADKPYANLDAADALVLANSYVPSDIALDPALASKFSSLRGTNSEQRLYPNFRLSTAVSDLDNHRASVSRTVQALGVASTASKLLGVVGDFSAIRWGVQRAIGLEMIEYGDPDGGGDLKRNNQVAFRAEVIYGWGIADLGAFALIVDKVVD
jgi:Phage capsid family.